MTVVIGISTKLYMSVARTRSWVIEVGALAANHPSVRDGSIQLFVAPTAAALESTVETLRGTGVQVAAQDVSPYPPGAYTGEIGASFLAELGVTIAEVGHAERRRLLGETDELIARKAAAATAAGLTVLICVGESEHTRPEIAAEACLAQLAWITGGPIMIAYEPVWAIGAERPAAASYVREVVRGIKRGLPRKLGSAPVLYGGSAGPGLLPLLRPDVDGLFLGRYAHDPLNVRAVLDDAAEELSSHVVAASARS